MADLDRLTRSSLVPSLAVTALLVACDAGDGVRVLPGPAQGSTDTASVDEVPSVAEARAMNSEQVPLSDYTPALGFALPARGSLTSSTATVGGAGGTPFSAGCAPGQVLAGIGGRAGSLIDRIGALCVALDEQGRWIGAPIPADGSFGGSGGTAFTRSCAPDSAVTGLRIHAAGGSVGGLELACTPASGSMATQGDAARLPRAGDAYPEPVSVTCADGSAATGLVGAAGALVDRIGLHCLETAARAGRWGNPIDWPLIAVHAVNTPDGKLLTYGTGPTGVQGAQFSYDVWDPSLGTGADSHATLENALGVDMFCGAAVVLPDSGDVLMPGGDARPLGRTNKGIRDATRFDLESATLARAADMGSPRWYPSVATLPDGDILITGGIDGGGNLVPTPEIYSPQKDEWRSLLGVSMLGKNWFYPRQWVAPDGRVFGASNRRMYFIDTEGAGSLVDAGPLPTGSVGNSSTAAMYQPGKILQVGGGNDGGFGAIVIDLNGAEPTARRTASMAQSRVAGANMQLLPDGTVLVMGGSKGFNAAEGASRTPELWDPASETWTSLSGHQWPRLYHSSAVLLQDGRVLLAGGGSPGPFLNLNAELFSPPYLFDADDTPRRRPVIASASVRAAYAQTVPVAYRHASDIARVTLVKTSAVTHSFNVEQRFMELPFTAQSDGTGAGVLQVSLPGDANLATPGHYFLFLLDAAGTPSKAHILQLGREPSIAAPAVDSTPPDATDVDTNRMVNGGFESGLSNWQTCADESLVRTGAGASTGTQALETSQGACLYQEFDIRAGERYRVQCDARTDPSVYSSLSLIMQDASYEALDSTVSVIVGERYRQYGGRVDAPAGAAIGALTLYAEGPAAFDNCLVTLVGDPVPGAPAPVPEPAPGAGRFVPVSADRDLLDNGDFEAGKRAWSDCAAGSLSRPTDDAHRGNGALQVSGAGCLYQEFATQPGERYRMQCRAKSEGSLYSGIAFQITDDQYTDLATDSQPVGENRFQTYASDLVAPARSALGAVTLYSEDVGVFDDCSVEKL